MCPNHAAVEPARSLLVGSKIGLDANRPIDPCTGALCPQVRDLDLFAETGAGWIRLNFVLGPWSGPDDETLHSGQTWRGAYTSIVTGLAGRGLRLYGLIGVEAVGSDPGDRLRLAPASGNSQDPWIDAYVARFVAIAEMFHDDVRVFESFNEPDDWHGQRRSWVHPGWFAIILQRIYAAVRARSSLSGIQLVSGPLQGLDENNNGAIAYLRETYRAGKRLFGWGQAGAPFPFDGIGYHIYVRQGYSAYPAVHEQSVRGQCTRYLEEMHALVRAEEGVDKPVYVSEAGWSSNIDAKVVQAREIFQARALTAGLDVLARDPLVAMGVWFCTQDFYAGTNQQFYGLYRPGEGHTSYARPAGRKPAYAAFQAVCRQSLAAPVVQPPAVQPPAVQPPAVQRAYTNQAVIDAFASAAVALGLPSRYSLLKKAGLSLSALAMNRAGLYRGTAIEKLPNLTEAERQLVLQKLALITSRQAAPSNDASPADTTVEDGQLVTPVAGATAGSHLTPLLLFAAALTLLLAACGIMLLLVVLSALVATI